MTTTNLFDDAFSEDDEQKSFRQSYNGIGWGVYLAEARCNPTFRKTRYRVYNSKKDQWFEYAAQTRMRDEMQKLRKEGIPAFAVRSDVIQLITYIGQVGTE